MGTAREGTGRTAPTPAETSGEAQAGALARIRDEFAALGWACVGILCGHVWIWEVPHRSTELLGPHGQGAVLYLALSALMLLAAAVAAAVRPRPRTLARLDWPLACVMAVATVLLAAPVTLPMGAGARLALGAVLGGMGIAWGYLMWSCYYACLDTRAIIACVFGAMGAGSALKVVLDLLPAAVCCGACVALCLAGPALVRAAQRRLDAQVRQGAPAVRGMASAEGLGYPGSPAHARREIAATVSSLAKVFVGVVAYGLVIGIIQGITVPADPAPKALLSGVHHGLEVVAALVVLWYVLGSRRGGLHFAAIWKVVLAATGAGVMLLPLVGPALAGWALVAVAVAQTLVVMLLWAMLADVARAHRDEVCPVVVFALGWTVYSLPFPVGMAIGARLGDTGTGAAWIGIIVYALALATVFFLNERDFSANRIFADLEGETLPPSMDEVVGKACGRIGAEAGLTERETDVMRLICLGRSKGYIAESLCISENTVRSHARHLYAKLGVHSKQDLLDIVQAQVAAHPRGPQGVGRA